jgi:hypothetical protein
MTTLEIILIITLAYIIIAQIFNFIATCETVLDTEDLICNLLWIFIIPYMILKKFTKILDKY